VKAEHCNFLWLLWHFACETL